MMTYLLGQNESFLSFISTCRSFMRPFVEKKAVMAKLKEAAFTRPASYAISKGIEVKSHDCDI